MKKQRKQPKRIPIAKFIEIANSCDNTYQIAEKTGYTSNGVLLYIKRLEGAGAAIKKGLWIPRQSRKAVVAPAAPADQEPTVA